MKKNHYKKILVGGVALFLIFAPVGITASTNHAFAQTPPSGGSAPTGPTTAVTTGAGAGTSQLQIPNFLDCAKQVATCGVYLTSLVANGAMSLLLVVAAWLVRLALQFNGNIFNSPAVQTGFSVSLAIANLGFVLGIIIIAIATIIRNQTYGIKQLLWKLVMMAILVNFGLVITAPIVGFADDMSNYFINATSPSAATGGYGAYVNTMMQAFSPQTLSLGNVAGTSGTGTQTASAPKTTFCQSDWSYAPLVWTICQLTSSPTTNPSDVFWQNLMSLLFDIVFSSLTVFVFLCLAVLLIVRYLMIGGLLIVLPLAWLTYVFPKFDSSFSKWWNNFIKWVFFPPIALFFIYLAFITATNTGTTTAANGTTNSSYALTAIGGGANNSNDTIEQSLANQTGLVGSALVQAADEILLVGLCVMGLMFANSLAGKAGSTVVNGATTVSRAVGGYVGGRARKHATRIYQKAGGEALNKGLQSSRIPLVGVLGRGLTNVTERGSKDLVAERSKSLNLAGMDDDRLISVTEGLKREEDQMAAVQEWQKRGKLDRIKEIGGGSFQDWLTKNQKGLGYMAQGKLKSDVDKTMMSSELMRSLARLKAEKGTAADVVDEQGILGNKGATVTTEQLTTAMDTASEKFWEGKDKGDLAKMRPDWVFTTKEKFGMDPATLKALQDATTHGIAVTSYANFGSIAGKVPNSEARDILVKSYVKSIEEGVDSGKISPKKEEEINGSLRKILNRINTQISGNDSGDPTDGDSGSGAGTPAPHP